MDQIEQAMRRALELAARGPEADPNPRVGCVLLDAHGTTVAQGWHQGAGTPHAEAMALALAGERARGTTAVVTLEPCNHTGRTGPCAKALVDAGVTRVVFAQPDPNPLATGGAATLRRAGVRVDAGCLAAEATELNYTWTWAQQNGRPWVTWKFAATLDGRSAAADGTSQWITGQAMRELVMELRGRCGAVVVGTGTALADDPRLTVRTPEGTLAERQPLRVVVGDRRLPATARVLDDSAPSLQLASHDPLEVLHTLASRGIHHAWLEGGPTLAAAFWRAGLVDEVVACLAAALLGAGPAAVADLGVTTIADVARLRLVDVHRAGDDLALVLRPSTTTPTTTTPTTTTPGSDERPGQEEH